MGNPLEEQKASSTKKAEAQKVVIDMSHVWTEEDKKRSPEKWAETRQGSAEKKEYSKKFAPAREYIQNKINEFKGYNDKKEIGQDWEEVMGDLNCGNERAAMERMEEMAGEEIRTKKDIDLWRKGVFEISKDVYGCARFVDKGKVVGLLYSEFKKQQDEMNESFSQNPAGFSEEDRKFNKKEVLRWQDASNEVFDGSFESALVLLEQYIEDKVEYDHNMRRDIEKAATGGNFKIEFINKTKVSIDANTKNLATYRKMRDSLYAIKFQA